MNPTTAVWTAIALVALLAPLAGCGSKGTSSAQAESKPPAQNPLEIQVRPDLLEQINVGQPKWEYVAGTLRVAGRVEADESRMARISVPVTGRIMDLEVMEGQHVERGQILAQVYSTDLSTIQTTLLKAHTAEELARRAVARAKQLLDAGVIGEAELQRREGDRQQALAELNSAREQLKVLGMAPESIAKIEATHAVDSLIPLRSTITGRVLERKITIGQVVQAAETAFVVGDLSNVWLIADVPEQNAGAIAIGKAVQAEIPALGNEAVSGKLSYVSALVDPETRTVRTRMNLPNPQRRFKPAMLATITLMDGAQKRLVLPPGAVVRESNEDYVFVQTAANKFLLRKVTLGPEYRTGRALEAGITENDRIVLDGAFHLNNERKRMLLRGGEGDS